MTDTTSAELAGWVKGLDAQATIEERHQLSLELSIAASCAYHAGKSVKLSREKAQRIAALLRPQPAGDVAELVERLRECIRKVDDATGGPQNYSGADLFIVQTIGGVAAALTAREAPGWRLVPEEPTPEMLGAFWRFKNGHHFADEPPPTDTSDYGAYRAMLAAAPQPKEG